MPKQYLFYFLWASYEAKKVDKNKRRYNWASGYAIPVSLFCFQGEASLRLSSKRFQVSQ